MGAEWSFQATETLGWRRMSLLSVQGGLSSRRGCGSYRGGPEQTLSSPLCPRCWHGPGLWMKGQIPSIEGAAYFLAFGFFSYEMDIISDCTQSYSVSYLSFIDRTSLIALSVPVCPAWLWVLKYPTCRMNPTSPWAVPGLAQSSSSWLNLELVWDGLSLISSEQNATLMSAPWTPVWRTSTFRLNSISILGLKLYPNPKPLSRALVVP